MESETSASSGSFRCGSRKRRGIHRVYQLRADASVDELEERARQSSQEDASTISTAGETVIDVIDSAPETADLSPAVRMRGDDEGHGLMGPPVSLEMIVGASAILHQVLGQYADQPIKALQDAKDRAVLNRIAIKLHKLLERHFYARLAEDFRRATHGTQIKA